MHRRPGPRADAYAGLGGTADEALAGSLAYFWRAVQARGASRTEDFVWAGPLDWSRIRRTKRCTCPGGHVGFLNFIAPHARREGELGRSAGRGTGEDLGGEMRGRSKAIIVGACLAFAVILALWALWPSFNRSWYECRYSGATSGIAEHGQFGDSFGSLNSLFTGLAFAGAVAALLLQWQGMRVQVDQFNESQRHQQLVDEMNVLQAALERVDDKLEATAGIVGQPPNGTQLWELSQRQRWMQHRRTIENRLAVIAEALGWELPRTTPPAEVDREGGRLN